MEFGEFKTAAVERDEWGELTRGRRGVGYRSGGFGCGFGFGWCSGWEEIRRVLFLQRVFFFFFQLCQSRLVLLNLHLHTLQLPHRQTKLAFPFDPEISYSS